MSGIPIVDNDISGAGALMRDVDKNIPSTIAERRLLRKLASDFIEESGLVPPISLQELQKQAAEFLVRESRPVIYAEYVAVLLNNELWRDRFMKIPYERRLLLLPKCLRVEAKCPAPFDEFGLLCKQCGLCALQDFQNVAEKLGYAVLIAEGSALVMKIIESGKIDAIVGVSCLSVLERAFPFMEAAAIPGIAVPLLQSDCKDTYVDIDWVYEMIHAEVGDVEAKLDTTVVLQEVRSWFSEGEVARHILRNGDDTSEMALEYVCKDGKRLRPFLLVSAYKSLVGEEKFDHEVAIKLALSIECFHKASLIHDDIQDEDLTRGNNPCLHVEHGEAIAINVGDFLIGEGYRLISEARVDDAKKLKLTEIAIQSHRKLCIGQGRELRWRANNEFRDLDDFINLFNEKTTPAFETAILMGGVIAGLGDSQLQILSNFSENLGIAYQIKDDRDDMLIDGVDSTQSGSDLAVSMAYRVADDADKKILKKGWVKNEVEVKAINDILDKYEIKNVMTDLLESYRLKAVHSLIGIESLELKGVLRRIVAKIFDELVVEGWCNDDQITDVAGSEPGTKSTA